MTFAPAIPKPVYTNIAAYKFVRLTDLKPLRDRLLAECRNWGLRGTILLSTEGINLCVAGKSREIELLLAELQAVAGLEQLEPKVSSSDHQPFTRMLVKIKKEIIAFGIDGIDPTVHSSAQLQPQELKQWLDEGRPIKLLDTRNDYEVKLGSFRNAVRLGIHHFREFPNAVRGLPAAWKQQPIVMFCTGGIRCEKAGPLLEREGFEQVFQLEGGILKYFEVCGSAHYDGECFVFDQRVGVDPNLRETLDNQCFVCWSSLTSDEQRDPRYVAGRSCPNCFQSESERLARRIESRQQLIRKATSPLPGSQPYDNTRPIRVPVAFDRRPLLELLSGIFGHIPGADWQRACDQGQLLDARQHPVGARQIVRAGERYLRLQRECSEPDVAADIRLVFEDESMIVAHKPAPLPVHPSGRFNRNTLQAILCQAYAPQFPSPVHRLDANTAGLVIFARTRRFAKLLQPQFARGEVEKLYLARIRGNPPDCQFSCAVPISTKARELGARDIDEEHGQTAQTEFRVVHRFDDGTTLVEAIPITGRTNQIRIHLWQLGWPVQGDQTYLPGNKLGDVQTLAVDAAPLCLFAQRLALIHPVHRSRVAFELDPPAWAQYQAALT